MAHFPIVVWVDHEDDLDSVWVALLESDLMPTLLTVPVRVGQPRFPLLVSVEAETAAAAEVRVNAALDALGANSWKVAQV